MSKIMELSTFYWIAGIGLAFIIGRAVLKKMSKKESKSSSEDIGSSSNKNPTLLKEPVVLVKEEKQIRDLKGNEMLKETCSSKQAFLKNINLFLPLLPKLQHGIMNTKEWNSVILSIDNPNLTSDWEKRCNLPIQRWIDKLASWGVSCEKCTAFKGNEYYADKYEITSDSGMVEGKQYEVIDWYWVLTSTNVEGVTEKIVILKGKAK